jgi:CheY-like chemotaxis protein
VRKPLVLHVEDEDAIAVLVQFALRELGAAVEWHRVSDAESAFEFLLTENEHGRRPEPDLILLDLNLPKKNGFEILAAIRQNSLLKHIPVVVLHLQPPLWIGRNLSTSAQTITCANHRLSMAT